MALPLPVPEQANPAEGQEELQEELPVCPQRCSTFLMPSATARGTFLPLLPHAPCPVPKWEHQAAPALVRGSGSTASTPWGQQLSQSLRREMLNPRTILALDSAPKTQMPPCIFWKGKSSLLTEHLQ